MRPAWMRKSEMSFLYRITLFVAWLLLKVFYRNKVYGLGKHYYPDAAIIAANHHSNFDPPILAVSWPQEVHFLAKEGLFKNRFFGKFITSLNAHPVSGDASDIGVFREITSLLKEGKKVILFPEGTRGQTEELAPLKPGIGLLVMRSQAAIVPAYIHGTLKVWGPGKKLPRLFGKVACVFGSPLRYEAFSHLEKREAHQAIADALRESILALKSWYLNGAKGTPP
jgi:1-acyl-sn-glycerol-3-phosphate acyltransferase